MFKDFSHHGMIGDFNDVKLLTRAGIDDYFVAKSAEQHRPVERKTAGVHT